MSWQLQGLYVTLLGGSFLYIAYSIESALPGCPLTNLFAIPGFIIAFAGLLYLCLNAIVESLRR